MKHRFSIFVLCLMLGTKSFFAQQLFEIQLDTFKIPNFKGIQSYAFGQHQGKILILGGRVDGLHRRQPFASFDEAGQPQEIIVLDIEKRKKWSVSINTLAVGIKEQLASSNMEFYQSDKYLYLIGGYGLSPSSNNQHITHPKLCAVDVPGIIDAIINKKNIASHIRQITDQKVAVTGGQLRKIDDTYYLVGGHRFDGRYNPMGPDHGPGFSQVYTNQVQKFKILDDGTNLTIKHLSQWIDTLAFHRRDFNVVPQIMPNGQMGLTAFSGVFQPTANVPYLNCVNIDSAGYKINNNFSQYYNHYHCANLGLYAQKDNLMHNIFFGGIAQYYDSLGILVQNSDVPFVKTIARVTRDKDGLMQEFKLPLKMPDYLGASAEFILSEDIPKFANDVINLDELKDEKVLLGYIVGGIRSQADNIFWINDGTQSSTNAAILKVYLTKKENVSTHQLNPQSINHIHLQVYPNPNNGTFNLKFNSLSTGAKLVINDSKGNTILNQTFDDMIVGENDLQIEIPKLNQGGTYFVTLKIEEETATQKVVIVP